MLNHPAAQGLDSGQLTDPERLQGVRLASPIEPAETLFLVWLSDSARAGSVRPSQVQAPVQVLGPRVSQTSQREERHRNRSG